MSDSLGGVSYERPDPASQGGGYAEGGPNSVRVVRHDGTSYEPVASTTELRDARVIEPGSPVVVVLSSGREIQAIGILQDASDEDPLIVEDAAGYLYVVAPDVIDVLIVAASLSERVLP